jgi:AcrR family transcriptional regulator
MDAMPHAPSRIAAQAAARMAIHGACRAILSRRSVTVSTRQLMPKKTKPKRIRNPVVTRAKLLQATMELVSEKGAAALSLKEVAKRARVSRGVAYLHFEDRGQLLKEAKAWISEGLQNTVTQFENATLHDRTFATTKIVLNHPEASKLLIEAAMAGTDLNRGNPLYNLVLNMLKDLKARGRAHPDLDVEIVTYIMFGSIAATLIMNAQHKKEDLDTLSRRFAVEWDNILQRGMFAPGVRVSTPAFSDASKSSKSKPQPRKVSKQVGR